MTDPCIYMYILYMLTWLGYIDGIYGAPYIAAPWILWVMVYKPTNITAGGHKSHPPLVNHDITWIYLSNRRRFCRRLTPLLCHKLLGFNDYCDHLIHLWSILPDLLEKHPKNISKNHPHDGSDGSKPAILTFSDWGTKHSMGDLQDPKLEVR